MIPQRCFLTLVARLVEAKDKTYSRSCVPTLALEVSGATLRVSGLAIIKNQLPCEPLTPRLHLFCSNSQDHMLHLACKRCTMPCPASPPFVSAPLQHLQHLQWD